MTRQIYCNICGGPFLGDDHTWLGQATLLSTGHRTQNGIEIDEYYCRPWCENSSSLGQHAPEDANRILLRLDAKHDSDYRTFRLLDWNEKVRANNLDGPISRFTGDALYLPVHKACLQLADHFIYTNFVLERAATDTTSGKITSELQLWEVLCRRLDDDFYGIPEEPHHFYVPPTIHTCLQWEPEPEPGEPDDIVWAHTLLMADPVNISNITQCVLENLKALPGTEGRSPKTQDESYKLLVNPRTLPWLWDLDVGYIRDKQLSARWDWEVLVRSISQPDIHMPSNDSLHIPMSLRNRRRIWRILEEARVNDLPVKRVGRIGHRDGYYRVPVSPLKVPPALPLPRQGYLSHVSDRKEPSRPPIRPPHLRERSELSRTVIFNGILLRFPPHPPSFSRSGNVP